MSTDQISRQRANFDAKANHYTAHHGDVASQEYRSRFFRDRLFNFDLNGVEVLDAMCAGGVDCEYFISRGANVTGLDISPKACELYTQRSGRPCRAASMHDTGFPNESFDVVYIIGGLHHILPLLSECMNEIHRLLKPGGYFVNFEPNANTWANRIREVWYRSSDNFDDSESAIDYRKQIRPFLRLGFQEELFFTAGNVAYMPIMNSGVLGVSLGVKKALSGPLCALEKMITPIPGVPRLYWCARWRKL